jgi:hypothetical protein
VGDNEAANNDLIEDNLQVDIGQVSSPYFPLSTVPSPSSEDLLLHILTRACAG